MTNGIRQVTAMVGVMLAWAGAAETPLHRAESLDGVTLTWGTQDPSSRLELNAEKEFRSEGEASIRAHSQAPAAAKGTSYVGFRLAIPPTRFGEDVALALEAWSSQPVATLAFHVRGFNAAGKQVVGWASWANPLTRNGRTLVLVPGTQSQGLGWETDRIEAAGDEVVALEFIAGCVARGEAFDMYIDHIRAVPAPKWVQADIVDHGLVAPVGMPTWGPSTIATTDRDGRRFVFTKLWTGGNASYLFIDAETGEVQQVSPGAGGWGAYQVHPGSDGLLYDTMGSHLVAIDPATRTVRKLGEIPAGMALDFTEAPDGTVYAGIYPSATLVSYHPASGTYTNHGALNSENWPQYLRPLAIDAAGWVYGGVAIQNGQVVGLNPATGEKRSFIPEEKRARGNPTLHLAADGKVYANAPGWGWHALSGGVAVPAEKPLPRVADKRVDTFPDGSRYHKVNVPDRVMQILDAGAETPREVRFSYASTGVNIYTLIAGPDGKIHGATGIPLRVWDFAPATGEMQDRGLGGYGGHINQFVRQGDKLYGAVYSSGALLEYDPAQPYDDVAMQRSKNPRQVHFAEAARLLYGRPHAVLAHPGGQHILVGGNADRVLLGSGLLIYDIATEEGTILDRDELIPDQGVNALAALPGGDVLVGTSVEAPTGGAAGTAKAALVYRLDWTTRTIKARWPLNPETPAVRDLLVGPGGLVYGLAEPSRFFVLDPERGVFLHDENLLDYGAASGYQAPRCLTFGPDGMIYALFRGAVVRIDPQTYVHEPIARPVSTITSGIAILDGRLYFGCGPRLFSCDLGLGE